MNATVRRPLSWNPLRWPLSLRIVLGVIIGAGLGVIFGERPYLEGTGIEHWSDFSNVELGRLAELVIQAIKALATPLIMFAILDAFLRSGFSGRQGLHLAVVCVTNVAIAMALCLAIMNLSYPGRSWEGRVTELAAAAAPANETIVAKEVSFIGFFRDLTPRSVGGPLVDNNVLPLIVLCMLFGAALRRVRNHPEGLGSAGVDTVSRLVETGYQTMLVVIGWVVELVPLAMLGASADVVGKLGLDVLGLLWIYLAVVVAGLTIHAVLYYPLTAWLIGGKRPGDYLGRGLNPVLTAFSLNSSLATAPVTLEALKELDVSDGSARLSTCVGTNFNNDGITLYEAMSVLFVIQAMGMPMTVLEQIPLLAACVFVSFGASGIPSAGLIVLPLVLATAGLSAAMITVVLPLIVIVDPILARCRSSVNALGDMQVAILLDRFGRRATMPCEPPLHDQVD